MNLREIPKILKAIWNWILNKHEDIADQRMKVCNKCDMIDNSGKSCAVPGTQPCCGICGCSLTLLVRSLDSECPHPNGSKWNSLIKK